MDDFRLGEEGARWVFVEHDDGERLLNDEMVAAVAALNPFQDEEVAALPVSGGLRVVRREVPQA